MLALYVIYATIIEFKASQGRPLDLTVATALGMLALVVAFSLPDTIIVSADGLQQISWLSKIKRIRWTEIAQINTWEKSRTVMAYFRHFPGNSSLASPRPYLWHPSLSRAEGHCALERTRDSGLLGSILTMQCDRLRNRQSNAGLI
ncbi:MAG TPA: hypothetical protein VF018_16590 [Acidobacteriaceae bacterium]